MNGAVAGAAVAQGGAAVVLVLGFALLAVRRIGATIAICAGQMVVVAVTALVQGDVLAAVVETAAAMGLTWWAQALLPDFQADGRRRSVQVIGSQRSVAFGPPGAVFLLAGAVLAALALAIPGSGIAFAVVLLGLLVAAGDHRAAQQVPALVAVQSGLVLSALSVGLTGWYLALAVLPLLPVFAAVGLSLVANRGKITALVGARPAAWIDVMICAMALLCAAALPWQLGWVGEAWRLDPRAAQMVLLVCALAAAGSWGQRSARPVQGSRVAVLAGCVLAVLAVAPLLAWAGIAVATFGAVASALPRRAEAWRRLRLGCTGLALALFGAIALHATPRPVAAMAAAMVGYGSLAVLAPELTVAAVAVILRLSAPPFLLLAAGLAALALGAVGLVGVRHLSAGSPSGPSSPPARASWLSLPRPSAHERSDFEAMDVPNQPGKMAGSSPAMTAWAGLAQGGVVVFAFGLGTPGGAFAGVVQLSFLALTQCALLLSRPEGLDRLAALAGLGGIPPFGLFASLALVLGATASAAPPLLVPLGGGLAAVGWAMLRRLPAERRFYASPAWLPLALLLLCGFAMPASWLAWFRLAAR
jgi:hypothetical protein